ncbi:hypothetical protein CUJ91_33615 (plasmid) [Paraburkholderia graminis]|uniref:hypothetical protein n=1 Tax=Paraburkholderia graminis TaxID=60548 RepID=UPI000DEF47DF|nr:hypothetical protein [Paraburkholderia graminis]AXF12893.1 hypothetical protein CUJ91_33615 [Paraburkholderia graminis]
MEPTTIAIDLAKCWSSELAGVDEIWGSQLWSKLQQLTYRGDSHGIALENTSPTTGNGPAGPGLFG